MNVVMIGTGYVGLVTGLAYAKLGHNVACVDIDETKIADLDMGRVPFFESGVPGLLKEQQEAGRIMFTSRLAEVISRADVIMIAVGTPADVYGACDLSAVYAVADEIGKRLEHEALIVVKSSVPVGTSRAVLERIHVGMRAAGREDLVSLIEIAFLPEFLREGTSLEDFLEPDRIVIGVDDQVTGQFLHRLHEGIDAPRVFMSVESAELCKYAANAFLATKLSFINEMANVAEQTGADIREVVKGIAPDKRIGPHFLKAGIGYGGSCFPKDVASLRHVAGERGYEFRLLSSVIEVNNRQRERFLKKVLYELGNLKGRSIGVWGLAFKEGTDDIRDSVAIDLVGRLIAHGASVIAYDPKAMPNAKRILPESVTFASTPIDAAQGTDALLVLTEWPQFKEVSFRALHEVMLTPVIFDGKNVLADLNLEHQGFAYYGVGLGSHQ